MDTEVNSLTQDQKESLETLKEKVSDVLQEHHDEHFILQWLKSRNFDEAKAEERLRQNLEWRKRWKVDQILTDYQPPEVLVKYFPGGISGFDKEGHPIWIVPAGSLDMKGLTLSAKRREILKYNVYLIEKVCKLMKSQSEKKQKIIDKVVIIEDLGEVTMGQIFSPGMNLIPKMLSSVEENYPEALKQCYIVNAPSIFPLIYKMVSPFMSEATKSKITILGSDWKETLFETIEPDQVPVYWGGTETGPEGDPKCSDKVCLGGEVPESFYLREQQLIDPKLYTSALVPNGSYINFKYEVDKPGCVLKWIFKTEDYDISFNIDVACDGRLYEVVPPKRVTSHEVPEDGVCECEKLGTYVVKFDNTYSWMTSKKLEYYIQVVEADGNIESLTSSPSENGDD